MSKDNETTQMIEAATTIAAALIAQRGQLSDAELRALPLVRSAAMADAVRHRLLTRYQVRVSDARTNDVIIMIDDSLLCSVTAARS